MDHVMLGLVHIMTFSQVENWAVSPRGAGWLFGPKVTSEFMRNNNLKLICRAHQLVHEGYK